MSQPTENSFLHDVRDHVLEVIRDDGVHRHIRLRKPGAMCMRFDLITWPGSLCYTGDMGTYVFSRRHDMFEFFRVDRRAAWLRDQGLTLYTNPPYWGEQLQAQDRHDGLKQFDEDKFAAAIRRRFVEWTRDRRDDCSKEERRALWNAIESEVLCADGGYRKQMAAHDFGHQVRPGLYFRLLDFWATHIESYSYRFMWCCYALAWGIQKYDDHKEAQHAPADQG